MSFTALDYVHGRHLGAVYFSQESAFVTPGAERRACVVADTVDITPTQVVITPVCLSSVPYDTEAVVKGDLGVTVAFSYYLQPATTVLTTGATPDDTAAAPLRIPLKTVFGGESVAAGSDVDTAASASSIAVTGGEGSRFPAGQVILVHTSDVIGWEVAQVRSRSTDAITVYPALGGTPAGGRDIVNTYCYYPTRTNSLTMSVALSPRNTDRQWRALGCTGSATFKFERGNLAVADFALTGATFSGPEALSLSIARAADTMAAPVAVRNAVAWLQPCATTTRVTTPIESVEVACSFGMTHLPSLTGTTEGERGVMRSEGLNDAFATITVVVPDNTDVYTWYAAQVNLSFTFFAKVVDASSNLRVVGFMAPQCTIVEYLPPVAGEMNLSKTRVVLRARMSEQCSGTLDNEELAQAPFVLFLG